MPTLPASQNREPSIDATPRIEVEDAVPVKRVVASTEPSGPMRHTDLLADDVAAPMPTEFALIARKAPFAESDIGC